MGGRRRARARSARRRARRPAARGHAGARQRRAEGAQPRTARCAGRPADGRHAGRASDDGRGVRGPPRTHGGAGASRGGVPALQGIRQRPDRRQPHDGQRRRRRRHGQGRVRCRPARVRRRRPRRIRQRDRRQGARPPARHRAERRWPADGAHGTRDVAPGRGHQRARGRAAAGDRRRVADRVRLDLRRLEPAHGEQRDDRHRDRRRDVADHHRPEELRVPLRLSGTAGEREHHQRRRHVHVGHLGMEHGQPELAGRGRRHDPEHGAVRHALVQRLRPQRRLQQGDERQQGQGDQRVHRRLRDRHVHARRRQPDLPVRRRPGPDLRLRHGRQRRLRVRRRRPARRRAGPRRRRT